MNIDTIIDSDESERIDLEYKHPKAAVKSITKELVALANSGGGHLILGIEEDGGKIVSVHSVDDPSSKEEAIQQCIRELVNPRLRVETTSETYTGESDQWEGLTVVVFSARAGNRVYSYREGGSEIVFPHRLGSTTDYMTGDDMLQFIQTGTRPGREGSQESERQELADPSEFDPAADESDDLNFSVTRDPPYRFSPGGGTPVTFRDTISFFQPYGIEGSNINVEKEELKSLLKDLKAYLGGNYANGRFAISQINASWYGEGIGNFVESIFSSAQRYNTTPPDFDLDKHHSEEAVFVTMTDFGLLIIRSRNGARSEEFLDECSINFIVEGIPVDTRSILGFLQDSNYEIDNAKPIDLRSEVLRYPEGNIQVDVVELIQSQYDGEFVGWALAKNPFFEEPDLLLDDLDKSTARVYEPVTREEYIRCRIGDHHPESESHRYFLQEVWLHDLSPAHGHSHINANVRINW